MWMLPYGPKEGQAGGRKGGRRGCRKIILGIHFIYVIVYENVNIIKGQYYYFHFTNKEQFLEKLSHTDDKWLVTSTAESKFTPFPLWHNVLQCLL